MPPVLVSVDVEASGPSPARHALLSIGACLVDDPAVAFYVEIDPGSAEAVPEAVAVSGLDLDRLRREGTPPADAMAAFAAWVRQSVGARRPLYVGFNAAFDWMWTSVYFHRHLGHDPFGHAPLCLKALYAGVAGVPWAETSFPQAAAAYGLPAALPHHALEDARLQAALARALLAESG